MNRRQAREAVGAAVTAAVIVMGCGASPALEASPIATPSGELSTPPASTGRTDRLTHATGPTDVVLRFDSGPDLGVSELTGEFFQPGPEFTLYGDGTAIFRDPRAGLTQADGAIIRAYPFKVAHLDEDHVQSLLRFALGEGGLGSALERYATHDTDDPGHALFTVRAGGVDKRIDIVGSTNPFEALADRLIRLDAANGVTTQIWEADRYWGNLFVADQAIDIGLLPDPAAIGAFSWPWPNVRPAEFGGLPDSGGWGSGRRAMSAEEAAVHGLSGNGGMVQRLYLMDPDDDTLYDFSLWPMLPDEVAEVPVAPTPGALGPESSPAGIPSVAPGPLRIDGLARVVTDRLRVRSAPEVSDASERLEPLLETGTMLFIIGGPVAGSGYDWYRIAPAGFGNGGDQGEFRYWGDSGPIGWVASADRDGDPWIEGLRIDCPETDGWDEGLVELERLGPLAALSCYGNRSIGFRATVSSPGFVDGFGDGAGPDPMYPTTYWAAPSSVNEAATFGSLLDPDRFPNGQSDIDHDVLWDVIGHFDDEAAAACRSDQPGGQPDAAWLTCRTTFVVTDVMPFTGIDPG